MESYENHGFKMKCTDKELFMLRKAQIDDIFITLTQSIKKYEIKDEITFVITQFIPNKDFTLCIYAKGNNSQFCILTSEDILQEIIDSDLVGYDVNAALNFLKSKADNYPKLFAKNYSYPKDNRIFEKVITYFDKENELDR